LKAADSREHGIYDAHVQGAHTMRAIAAKLGLSVSKITRLIASFEARLDPVSPRGVRRQRGASFGRLLLISSRSAGCTRSSENVLTQARRVNVL
jgi:DNA-binding MarR family transcriptional regulator